MTREEAIMCLYAVKTELMTRRMTFEGHESAPITAVDMAIEALSAEAVPIHEDGTLEVKVPNAQKVGRVLVMDTDSHIGGGLFYPESAKTEGDLISRQWLLEVYGDYIGDNGETKYHVPLEVVRQNIKDAPSAEPKTGEWEMCKDDDGIYGVCSICGRDADFSHYGIPYKFCPNCGAKMDRR